MGENFMKIIPLKNSLLNQEKFDYLLLIKTIDTIIDQTFLKLTDELGDNLALAELTCLSQKSYRESDYREINKIFDKIAHEIDTVLEDHYDKIKLQINENLSQLRLEEI